MSAHVCLEVVGPGELSLADLALEGADPGVLAAVAPELVRAGEPLPASLMVTDIWLLTSVLPDVHLEVGELQVALGAARVEADKRLSLLIGLGGRDSGLLVDEIALDISWWQHERGLGSCGRRDGEIELIVCHARGHDFVLLHPAKVVMGTGSHGVSGAGVDTATGSSAWSEVLQWEGSIGHRWS